jgi:putative transcription antitermination factor YqgF
MKLMALDFGHKRVGVASTDESGNFALPRAVWLNDASLLEKVITFMREEEIEKIILGESKNLVMEANPIRTQAEEFKQALEARGVEVIWHPEMFTTMEARQIQGNTDMTDASAAALILKSYIDSN